MTARHHLLVVGGVALLVVGIYLFFEVRAVPSLMPAPTAKGAGAEPDLRPQGSVERALDDRVPPTAVSAPPQAPEPMPGEDDDPERANPSIDAVMDRANKAYDHGEFEEAREIAIRVLAKFPTNVRMMRIVVSAGCMEGEVALAQEWFDKLPQRDRDQMKVRCERYGVTFRDPP